MYLYRPLRSERGRYAESASKHFSALGESLLWGSYYNFTNYKSQPFDFKSDNESHPSGRIQTNNQGFV